MIWIVLIRLVIYPVAIFGLYYCFLLLGLHEYLLGLMHVLWIIFSLTLFECSRASRKNLKRFKGGDK